jgi:hypothetical protein
MNAIYNGLIFRTPLHARWAAFFDLAGWIWHTNPAPVGDWSPDFRVTFPCSHSECGGSHTLLVSVLPVSTIDGFGRHPCLDYSYGIPREGSSAGWIGADSGAAFGESPKVTRWEMSHGAGGGMEDVFSWVSNADQLWKQAGTMGK